MYDDIPEMSNEISTSPAKQFGGPFYDPTYDAEIKHKVKSQLNQASYNTPQINQKSRILAEAK